MASTSSSTVERTDLPAFWQDCQAKGCTKKAQAMLTPKGEKVLCGVHKKDRLEQPSKVEKAKLLAKIHPAKPKSKKATAAAAKASPTSPPKAPAKKKVTRPKAKVA